MSALTEVVRRGKARYIGFSEWSPEQIAAAFALPDVDRFVSSQPQYSMLWRQVEERVIPLCREKQVSQIVWSPLAQGVLTGKYSPNAPPPAGSRASSDSMGQFIKRWTEPNIPRKVQKLKPIRKPFLPRRSRLQNKRKRSAIWRSRKRNTSKSPSVNRLRPIKPTIFKPTSCNSRSSPSR